jgi:hypothetical protein
MVGFELRCNDDAKEHAIERFPAAAPRAWGYAETPLAARGRGGTPRSTPRTLRAHQFEPIMSGVWPARYLSEPRRRCGGTGGARKSPFADVGWGEPMQSWRRCGTGCGPEWIQQRACVCVSVSACGPVCQCACACACVCVCVVCVLRGLLYYSRGYYATHTQPSHQSESQFGGCSRVLAEGYSGVLTGYSGGAITTHT